MRIKRRSLSKLIAYRQRRGTWLTSLINGKSRKQRHRKKIYMKSNELLAGKIIATEQCNANEARSEHNGHTMKLPTQQINSTLESDAKAVHTTFADDHRGNLGAGATAPMHNVQIQNCENNTNLDACNVTTEDAPKIPSAHKLNTRCKKPDVGLIGRSKGKDEPANKNGKETAAPLCSKDEMPIDCIIGNPFIMSLEQLKLARHYNTRNKKSNYSTGTMQENDDNMSSKIERTSPGNGATDEDNCTGSPNVWKHSVANILRKSSTAKTPATDNRVRADPNSRLDTSNSHRNEDSAHITADLQSVQVKGSKRLGQKKDKQQSRKQNSSSNCKINKKINEKQSTQQAIQKQYKSLQHDSGQETVLDGTQQGKENGQQMAESKVAILDPPSTVHESPIIVDVNLQSTSHCMDGLSNDDGGIIGRVECKAPRVQGSNLDSDLQNTIYLEISDETEQNLESMSQLQDHETIIIVQNDAGELHAFEAKEAIHGVSLGENGAEQAESTVCAPDFGDLLLDPQQEEIEPIHAECFAYECEVQENSASPPSTEPATPYHLMMAGLQAYDEPVSPCDFPANLRNVKDNSPPKNSDGKHAPAKQEKKSHVRKRRSSESTSNCEAKNEHKKCSKKMRHKSCKKLNIDADEDISHSGVYGSKGATSYTHALETTATNTSKLERLSNEISPVALITTTESAPNTQDEADVVQMPEDVKQLVYHRRSAAVKAEQFIQSHFSRRKHGKNNEHSKDKNFNDSGNDDSDFDEEDESFTEDSAYPTKKIIQHYRKQVALKVCTCHSIDQPALLPAKKFFMERYHKETKHCPVHDKENISLEQLVAIKLGHDWPVDLSMSSHSPAACDLPQRQKSVLARECRWSSADQECPTLTTDKSAQNIRKYTNGYKKGLKNRWNTETNNKYIHFKKRYCIQHRKEMEDYLPDLETDLETHVKSGIALNLNTNEHPSSGGMGVDINLPKKTFQREAHNESFDDDLDSEMVHNFLISKTNSPSTQYSPCLELAQVHNDTAAVEYQYEVSRNSTRKYSSSLSGEEMAENDCDDTAHAQQPRSITTTTTTTTATITTTTTTNTCVVSKSSGVAKDGNEPQLRRNDMGNDKDMRITVSQFHATSMTDYFKLQHDALTIDGPYSDIPIRLQTRPHHEINYNEHTENTVHGYDESNSELNLLHTNSSPKTGDRSTEKRTTIYPTSDDKEAHVEVSSMYDVRPASDEEDDRSTPCLDEDGHYSCYEFCGEFQSSLDNVQQWSSVLNTSQLLGENVTSPGSKDPFTRNVDTDVRKFSTRQLRQNSYVSKSDDGLADLDDLEVDSHYIVSPQRHNTELFSTRDDMFAENRGQYAATGLQYKVEDWKDVGSELSFKGLVYIQGEVFPYVIRDGYRFVIVRHAMKLFTKCVSGCRISLSVLLRDKHLFRTMATWDEVNHFDLVLFHKDNVYKPRTGDAIIRLDAFARNFYTLLDDVKEEHRNTNRVKSRDCAYTFD